MKKIILFVLLFGGLTAGALYAVNRISGLERAATIAEANAAALRDTVMRYRADSTQTATRMALQAELADSNIAALSSSLADALRDRRQSVRALNRALVEIDSLKRVIRSTEVVEGPGGEERGTFELEGPPIEGQIIVTYRPEDPWDLATRLGVTPFEQVVSLGCDPERRAIFNLTSPDWVRVTPQLGTVDPDLCNPPAPKLSLATPTVGKGLYAALGGLVGYLAGRGGGSCPLPSYDY